jgi:hypothetical protein
MLGTVRERSRNRQSLLKELDTVKHPKRAIARLGNGETFLVIKVSNYF